MFAIFFATVGGLFITGNAVPFFKCEMLDLTHNLNENNPIYPVFQPFEITQNVAGAYARAPFVAYRRFCSYEHIGTHMDAPRHFVKDASTLEEVPLTQVVGEACVFDISKRAAKNPDASLKVEDVEKWETEHGRIPERAIILLHTGWSNKYWNDHRNYLGSNYRRNANSVLHYPSFSPEVAQWFVDNRNISAVGADVIGLDVGTNRNFNVHIILFEKGIVGVENMHNIEKLPPRGATVFIPPIKLEGGTGGYVRAFAIGWKGNNDPCRYSSAPSISIKHTLTAFLAILCLFYAY